MWRLTAKLTQHFLVFFNKTQKKTEMNIFSYKELLFVRRLEERSLRNYEQYI